MVRLVSAARPMLNAPNKRLKSFKVDQERASPNTIVAAQAMKIDSPGSFPTGLLKRLSQGTAQRRRSHVIRLMTSQEWPFAFSKLHDGSCEKIARLMMPTHGED